MQNDTQKQKREALLPQEPIEVQPLLAITKKDIAKICTNSRKIKQLIGLTGCNAKERTEALTAYTNTNKNTYLVHCAKGMRPKKLYESILQAMQVAYNSKKTAYELMCKIITELNNHKQTPILIIDNIDDLSNISLMYVNDVWDYEDTGSIILSGTNRFRYKLLSDAKKQKQGMPELNGRINIWYEVLPILNTK